MNLLELSSEEQVTYDVILAARKVQNYLFGKPDGCYGWEEWRRMFRKRLVKLDNIDESKQSANIEVRKRLLQTAALAVAFIHLIDKLGHIPVKVSNRPSDHTEYSDKICEVHD
jgi:hypothetical protein